MAKDRIDRDEEDLVRLYLTDIGQYALLTKDDEVRLAKAIETGKEATAELEGNDKALTPNRRRELRKDQRDGTKAERHGETGPSVIGAFHVVGVSAAEPPFGAAQPA